MEQEIHFCTTSDNVQIAYSTAGTGPPFVKVANWLNHLEADWKSPIWRHLLDEFRATTRSFVMMSEVTAFPIGMSRNFHKTPLSAIWNRSSTLTAWIGFRSWVFHRAVPSPSLTRFGIRKKVSHLILFGAFARGWRKLNLRPEVAAKREAQLALFSRDGEAKIPQPDSFSRHW